MTRFVALLRGVNVGRAKRVPMAGWRALLTGLGYEDVATLLNSGNAVFTASGRTGQAHARLIRAALAQALDLDVPVIVKSAREMAAIVVQNPFAALAGDPSRLLVGFAAAPEALARLADIASLVQAPEQFHLGAQALYLWCPAGILQSRAGEVLLGPRGREITTRNAATVGKIVALLDAGADA